MAHTEQLSPAALAGVAAQIAQRTPPGVATLFEAAAHPPVVAESFPVVMLPADRLADGKTLQAAARQRMSEWLTRTGLWHHQIAANGRADAFARSAQVAPGAGEQQVVEVARSTLPEALSTTIRWIDEHAEGDPMVRLLTVPAYYVTAFWLEYANRDAVVVAERPQKYDNLPLNRIMPAPEFLERLAASGRSRGAEGDEKTARDNPAEPDRIARTRRGPSAPCRARRGPWALMTFGFGAAGAGARRCILGRTTIGIRSYSVSPSITVSFRLTAARARESRA